MTEKQGRVTIYDVAALAGVSVSSVSRVLHGVPNVRKDVREHVEKAIRELGYVPNRTAQMLKTHRSYTLVHVVADVTQPFYITLHRRLRQEAEKRGYQIVLFDADRDGERVQRYMQQSAGSFDALICSARSVHGRLLEVLEESRLPIIFTHDCEQTLFDACYPHPSQGTRLCMEHLLSLGHRRIAYVGSNVDDIMNRERLAEYKKILREQGIAEDEALILLVDEQMNGGYRAGVCLAQLDAPPTAVYTSGDMIAAGVVQVMNDRKWPVPGKVSVTGENDLEISRSLSPALTTVTDPAEMIAETVIGCLLDRVEGRYDGPARSMCMKDRKLIVRGSTGAV